MEILLTKQEKWNQVKKLLMEGKTYREIQSNTHVSPTFITKVKIAEFGENYLESENLKKNKLSKRTQAIDLLFKGQKPYEIIKELDIDVNEVKQAQADYLQLLNLDIFSRILRDNNSSNLLIEFNNLFRIFEELKINNLEKVQEIKRLVELYPDLKYKISSLNMDIQKLLNQEKNLQQDLTNIEYNISLADSAYNARENQIQNKKIIIENLQCLFDKMKSSEAYNNLEKIIESIIKDEYWYKTSVLPLIIISVLEVIRDDPRGKAMILDYYEDSFGSIHNNKSSIKTEIEDITNHIFDNYLHIIMDINEYSQKLHDNLWKIYPHYLLSKIIQMPYFDNLSNSQNSQKDNNNNNNQFSFNFGQGLKNSNSCIYIE